MQDASTLGRAAHRSKSINVELNLLSQRTAERNAIRESLHKMGAILIFSALAGAVLLPSSFKFQASASKRYQVLKHTNEGVLSQLSNLKQAQEEAKPAIQDVNLISGTKKNSQQFVGQLLMFFDAVNPSVYLGGAKATVNAGEMSVQAKASAMTYRAASEFINVLSRANSKKDSCVVSSMQSDSTIGPEGVTFDVERKVTVAP